LEEFKKAIADVRNAASARSTASFLFATHAPANADDDEAPLPGVMGRYQLIKRVGMGGFGQVWEGYDPLLQRKVAIKIPRKDRLLTAAQKAALFKEARRVAGLVHPGIIATYDVGSAGDQSFVVSEFIEGLDLAKRLAEKELPLRESVQIVIEVAEALHFAHLCGVVHRDVKPQNILVDRAGRARLADFGLAATEEELAREPAQRTGTYRYMSPEQARGDSNAVDGRSDIFSLGVVFFQLLTKRLPFHETATDSIADYLLQIQTRDARPPRSIDDRIPHELEGICLKCLRRDIHERYTTASDLAADLRRWLSQVGAQASTATSLARVPAWRRSHIYLLAAALGSIALTVATVAFFANRSPTSSGQPAPAQPATPQDKPERDPLDWSKALPQPVELEWPGFQHKSSWRFDEKVKGLVLINSGPLQLVQLGTIRASRTTKISLELEQPQGAGNAGLFFGYHVQENATRGKIAAFQSLQFIIVQNDARSPLQMQRRFVYVLPESGSVVGERIDSCQVPYPPPDGLIRLAVTVKGNNLESVSWNGLALDSLVSMKDNHPNETRTFSGIWGVSNRAGTLIVRRPTHTEE
jgi:serine/threonine protein kinase